MAPLPLLICSLLAATALAAREWTRAEEGHARAGDAVLDSLRGERHGSFGYESHNGPDKWPSLFPDCGGKAQSPVSIWPKDSPLLECPSPLKVPKLEWEENQLMMINNGHTVMLEPMSPSSVQPLTLSGGVLRSEYRLVQMHFHWGTRDDLGSEHSLDGFYAAMEMHMVFARNATRRHHKLERAPHDLVVIAVFLQGGHVPHPSLEVVAAQLPQVPRAGTATPLQSRFNASRLLAPVYGGVLTYAGSLTTPPCSEVVLWLVFRRPVGVASSQVEQFRRLRSADGPLEQNRRPAQPLNGRVVFWACDLPPPRGRAARRLPWAPVLACALYCAMLNPVSCRQ